MDATSSHAPYVSPLPPSQQEALLRSDWEPGVLQVMLITKPSQLPSGARKAAGLPPRSWPEISEVGVEQPIPCELQRPARRGCAVLLPSTSGPGC